MFSSSFALTYTWALVYLSRDIFIISLLSARWGTFFIRGLLSGSGLPVWVLKRYFGIQLELIQIRFALLQIEQV